MSAPPACPLCRGRGPAAFVRSWREWTLWDCPDCGAGFCEPFRNPGPEYYEHKTDVYAVLAEETTDPMSFEYDEGLALLRRALPRGARVLDVGCGAGGFLHRLRESGFAPSGLDFNPARVAALRARGDEVFDEPLAALARRAAGTYDAVVMFELVEHLDDPAAWLGAARALLKPGGLLVLGTPNRERTFDPFVGPGLEEIDNPPHHLTRWSAAALTRLLERSGFRVESCRALAVPRPLLALLLRGALSFGVARRSLGVARLDAPAPSAARAPSARERLVYALVAAKSAAIDALAFVLYPLFRAACALFGWRGAILLAAARVTPG